MENSISELLDELPGQTDRESLSRWCNRLCDFYRENERHSYSEITEYILKKDGGIEYTYEIVRLLKEIREHRTDEVGNNIDKLIDHIQLEQIRYQYLSELISEDVNDRYIRLNNESIDGIHEVKEQLKEAQQQLEEAKDKVEKLQSENITILGIFASIVLTFTAMMMFSSSVLENIEKSSAYRILFVCLFIGFIFFNVIMGLMLWINSIVYTDQKKKKFCACIIFALSVDLVLIATIVMLRYDWNHSLEKQVQDRSRQNYLMDLQDNYEEQK